MNLALTSTSLHEASDHLSQPYVSAVVVNAQLVLEGSHHQATELLGEAAQSHKKIYVLFPLASTEQQNFAQLHRQLVSLWNRSHAVVPVLPYSPIALEKAHWASTLGLPLHVHNLSTLAESIASVESKAGGGWISLGSSPTGREQHATEELLTQLRTLAENDAYLVVASNITTDEQLEFATEFGAELAVISPELVFRRSHTPIF